MSVLNELLPCDPPETFRSPQDGPTQPIDCAILNHLAGADTPQELRAITQAVGGTTHHVHARVMALVARGLVHRQRTPGGPRRGPGASVYALTEARSWTCPS